MPEITRTRYRSSFRRILMPAIFGLTVLVGVGAVVATSVTQSAAADEAERRTAELPSQASGLDKDQLGAYAAIYEQRAAYQQQLAAERAAYLASPAGAQETARGMAASQYGWGDDQFSCLVSLWNRESGWNVNSYNASSGATGIPQALPGEKMAIMGEDWQTNPATQIAWGLSYISSSYGTPCGAWNHSESYNWY